MKTCNFIQKQTLAKVFSCEYFDNSKNTIFTEHLWATTSEWIDWYYCKIHLFKTAISAGEVTSV